MKGTKKCTNEISICLHCGFQGCEQLGMVSHSRQHHIKNQDHCLFIRFSSRLVHCYFCNQDLSEEQFKYKPRAKKMIHRFFKLINGQCKSGRNSKNHEVTNWSDLNLTELVQQSDIIPYRYTGLQNLSNTCYFNSLLQCLFRSKLVREELFIMENPNIKHSNFFNGTKKVTGSISKELYELFFQMSSTSLPCVAPSKLLKSLSYEKTSIDSYFEQQDAFECFSVLIELLTNEIELYRKNNIKKPYKDPTLKKRPEEKCKDFVPWTTQVFRGTLLSLIRCSECNYESSCNETINSLSISISTRNISDSIENSSLVHCWHSKLNINQGRQKNTYPICSLYSQFGRPRSKSTDVGQSIKFEIKNMDKIIKATKNLNIKHQINKIKLNKQISVDTVSGNLELINKETRDTEKPSLLLSSITYSLEECLVNFFSPETLDGENKFNCPQCSENKGKPTYTCAERVTYFKELPNLLLVHLKRFETISKGKICKINTPVSFPPEIIVPQFEKVNSVSKFKDIKYQLISVICHTGRIDYGHYVSYVIGPKNDEWTLIDDDRKVLEKFSNIPTKYAYMLFYTRMQCLETLADAKVNSSNVKPQEDISSLSSKVVESSNLSENVDLPSVLVRTILNECENSNNSQDSEPDL